MKVWKQTEMVAVLMVSTIAVSAQEPPRGKKPPDGPPFERGPGPDRGQGPPPDRRGPDGPGYHFLSSEMRFEGRVVKGAPYSATAVTESIQLLADGTRIARKTEAIVARDSEGRTRREQKLEMVGPFAPAGEPPTRIFINDVVAKVSYELDPRSQTARRLGPPPPDGGASPSRPRPPSSGGCGWRRSGGRRPVGRARSRARPRAAPS